MSEQSGYRAFPPFIAHPSKATRISIDEFSKLDKQKLEEAPPACEGHLGTAIWYCGQKGYLVQVKLKSKPDVFAFSLCTFTPTFGMDQIDGLFAQDIEEYILNQELGFKTERLDVFQQQESIPVETYLKDRRVI